MTRIREQCRAEIGRAGDKGRSDGDDNVKPGEAEGEVVRNHFRPSLHSSFVAAVYKGQI